MVDIRHPLGVQGVNGLVRLGAVVGDSDVKDIDCWRRVADRQS